MKYSPQHIKAVEERLCEYLWTLLSGINCLQYCKICDSIAAECISCILNMNACIGSRISNDKCFTKARLEIYLLAEDWGFIERAMRELDDYEFNLVKARYIEICEYIEKQCGEFDWGIDE